MPRIAFAAFLLCIAMKANSQTDMRCAAYTGYIEQDIRQWERAAAVYGGMQVRDELQQREYILTLYGYVAYLYLREDCERAKEYNDLLKKEIDIYAANKDEIAFVNAMNTAYYGYLAVISPGLSSMYYLYKCREYMDAAVINDPESPYAWAEKGNVSFQTACVLGGDFEHIAGYYQRSIALFEASDADLSCNWYYINCLLFYAKCFEEQGKAAEAVQVYAKILRHAPGYAGARRWMKKQQDIVAACGK